MQLDIINAFDTLRLGKLFSSEDLDEILQYCDEYTPSNPPQYFFDRSSLYCILLSTYVSEFFTGSGFPNVFRIKFNPEGGVLYSPHFSG